LPRFYFDVLDGDAFTRDDGFDLMGLDAAEGEAIRAIAGIGQESLPKRPTSELCVRVRDSHGYPVLTVTLSLTVRRMDSEHA
jgi:hypothetical protein